MATQMRTTKKVLLYGNFDPLHANDIKLFEQASKLGDLYVCIENHHQTKFANDHDQQLYILQSIKYIHNAFYSPSNGTNIENDLDNIKPDIFYVTAYNNTNTKRILAKKHGIEYIVASQSHVQIQNPEQSFNELIPWRLCIAGAWLDQPWVSQVIQSTQTSLGMGSCIVMNVKYHHEFRHRSGLATSSRKTAIKLWEHGIVPQKLQNEEIARLLFGAENPPGTKYISGSQDHLGLLLPGINRLDYNGKYWPMNIVNIKSDAKENGKNINDIYSFVEQVLWLVPIGLRPKGFDPLEKQDLSVANVEKLANASTKVWKAILNCDIENFGIGLTQTLKAYKLILPNTVPKEIDPIWQKLDKENYGCSFSGAGGGGFLMVVSDKKPNKNAYQIKINDKEWWKKNRNKHYENNQCQDEQKRSEIDHHMNVINHNLCTLMK